MNLEEIYGWDPGRVIIQAGQFPWSALASMRGHPGRLPVTVTVELYQQGPDLIRVRLDSDLPEVPYLHTLSGGSSTFTPDFWAAAMAALRGDQ